MYAQSQLAKWLKLILVISLGVVLRIWSLDKLPNGLHWDEQDTGYQAYSLLKTGKDYFGNILPLFPHSLAEYRTPVLIYSTVPSVKIFGLSPFSVRILPVVFGILGIITFGLLVYITSRNPLISIFSFLVISISIWHIQYSRQAVESIVMSLYFLLGLTCFFRKKYIISALMFGLSMWAYSTAKMFVPVFVLVLLITNIKNINKKLLIIPGILFFILSVIVIGDGMFGKSGQRFRELSIFTDPTIAKQVDRARQTQQLSSGASGVGLQPRLIDKIIYNKPILWFDTFIKNYVSAFSTEFLFVRGDQELRHSPSREGIGMLYLIEVIPLFIGIYVAFKNKNYWLIFWFLFGAVPGALTRTDNPHAARLFIMLPVILYLVVLGIYHIYRKSKFMFVSYFIGLLASSIFTFSYYFSVYRWESAAPFQYGFDQVIKTAVSSSGYDRIIIDGKQDSLLMAYLFNSSFDPAKFQSMLPLPTFQPYSNVYGNKFNNIYLLFSGERTWRTIWNDGETGKKTLLIVANGQPDLDPSKSLPSGITRLSTINYPDSTVAFQVIEGR
ncbi:MAG: hypothetical protein Q8L51_03140 [Candidatus Amesbacteria bacterium]|nr:hypothetical protein [Candidatus Amesbacteria bacterium]